MNSFIPSKLVQGNTMKHRLINSNHQNYVNMRREAEFSDVLLVAEDVEIPAHKIVLSAWSPYFRAMFANFAEGGKDRINIGTINGNMLKILIDYLYKAEVFVAEKDVQPLLIAASYLQLTRETEACCKFLIDQLKPSNCLSIAEVASKHYFKNVEDAANTCIGELFTDVVKSKEFLQLSVDELEKLIKRDCINACEEEVFECVIAWITNSFAEREKYIQVLMKYVRLPLLSCDFLYKRVKEEPLIKNQNECLHDLLDAMYYSTLDMEQKALMPSSKFKRRYSEKVFLAIGGDPSQMTVEYFGLEGDCSYRMTNMPEKRICFSVATIGYTSYVIGGIVNGQYSNSMISFDSKNNSWYSCANMAERRVNPGVAVLDDLIYVIGGPIEGYSSASAEVYNLKTMTWKMIASMASIRTGAGVAVISGDIYVVGGHCSGRDSKYFASMERYCPEKNEWTNAVAMSFQRSSPAVATMNGLLYAVGGQNRNTLRSAESYNPKSKSWTQISDMNGCRKGAVLIPTNNLLYVVGGTDEKGTKLSSVEVYNPTLKTWTVSSTSMSSPKIQGGLTLIKRPKFLNKNPPAGK